MEDFLDSLTALIKAKASHDKACAEYDGYEWGYHGWPEISALSEAEDNFKKQFKITIKEILQEIEDENGSS